MTVDEVRSGAESYPTYPCTFRAVALPSAHTSGSYTFLPDTKVIQQVTQLDGIDLPSGEGVLRVIDHAVYFFVVACVDCCM
jgi:hypothetical protein